MIGIEIGAFDQHVRRRLGDAGMFAAHDSADVVHGCVVEDGCLIGMNATRAMTIMGRETGRGSGEVLSVGRVQTPTLSLVVSRDREIASFIPSDYFVLRACLEQVWMAAKAMMTMSGLMICTFARDQLSGFSQNAEQTIAPHLQRCFCLCVQ